MKRYWAYAVADNGETVIGDFDTKAEAAETAQDMKCLDIRPRLIGYTAKKTDLWGLLDHLERRRGSRVQLVETGWHATQYLPTTARYTALSGTMGKTNPTPAALGRVTQEYEPCQQPQQLGR